MNCLRMVLLSLSMAVAATAVADPIQWPASEGGNGHWYGIVDARLSWTAARADAAARGGHLATITSQAELDFIWTNLHPIRSWLGGIRDGGWRWITGEPWAYTNWYPGEPNGGASEPYLQFSPGLPYNGTWNDNSNCGHVSGCDQPYLIEYDQHPDACSLLDVRRPATWNVGEAFEVVGVDFVEGMSLRIGPIQVTDFSVTSSELISARVPDLSASGIYDLVVAYPDGRMCWVVLGAIVGAEELSWGAVKSMYR
ncbi:MAG: hypothetical protein IPK64_18510 [bacterium]|nr:hypothetical protein [bacterium]